MSKSERYLTSPQKLEMLGVTLLFLLSFWFRLPFLLSTTFGFRQTQTAWPVKAWLSENEFNAFSPKVPIRGLPQDWLLEFPLFQWVSYFSARIFSLSADSAVSIMAVICWFAISILVYIFVRKLTNIAIAFSALVLLLFSPFGLRWGSTGLSDLISTTCALLALFLLLNHYCETRQKSTTNLLTWILVPLLLAISAIIKPNIALMYLVPIFLIGLLQIKQPSLFKRLAFLSLTGASLLVSVLFWTQFASSKLSEYDPRSIWKPNSDTLYWYFGTQSQYRDALSLNLDILYRVLISLGGVALFVLAIVGLFLVEYNLRKLSLFIFAGIFLSWTIFINLNIVHNYYQIPAVPLLVLAISMGMFGWVTTLRKRTKIHSRYLLSLPCISVSLAIILSYQFVDVATAETNLVREKKGTIELAKEVALHTNDERGLIIGFGMTHDPTVLYQSNRRGFLLYNEWYPSELEYLYAQNLDKFCYLVSAEEELDEAALEVLSKFPKAVRVSAHVYRLCQ